MADLLISVPLLQSMLWTRSSDSKHPGAWVRLGAGGPGFAVKAARPIFSERQHPERVVWSGRRYRVVTVPPNPDHGRVAHRLEVHLGRWVFGVRREVSGG